MTTRNPITLQELLHAKQTMVYVLYSQGFAILHSSSRDSYYYCFHFTDEGTEAQRD